MKINRPPRGLMIFLNPRANKPDKTPPPEVIPKPRKMKPLE